MSLTLIDLGIRSYWVVVFAMLGCRVRCVVGILRCANQTTWQAETTRNVLRQIAALSETRQSLSLGSANKPLWTAGFLTNDLHTTAHPFTQEKTLRRVDFSAKFYIVQIVS